MRTFFSFLQSIFIGFGLLGLYLALYNTDFATGLFIDPELTPYAVLLTVCGIFGTAACWFLKFDHDLHVRNPR